MNKIKYKINQMKKVGFAIISVLLIFATINVNAGSIGINKIQNVINECSIDIDNKYYFLETVELNYYSGDEPTYLFGGIDIQWQAAVRFTPDELGPYNERIIDTVRFFHGCGFEQPFIPHNGTVYIYAEGNSSGPGIVITQEVFYADVIGWITIPLSSPVEINATKDLWISIETTGVSEENYYFGLGSPPGVNEKSMWFYNETDGWIQLTELNSGYSFDWFIGAILSDELIPGDVDNSGAVDIDDVTYLLNYIFNGGPVPNPYCLGDVNCDDIVDIDDVAYLISYIFSGGPEPVPAC